MLTRRDFAKGSLGLWGSTFVGCATPGRKTPQKPPPEAGPVERYQPATDRALPLYEIRAGSHYALGRAVGRRFAAQIRGGFEDRAEWFRELKAFADARPRNIYDTFLAAARKHAPHIVEELRGWADGCGLPFRDLMILNLKAEYAALRDQEKPTKKPEPHPGCSTLVAAGARRFVIVHNEDGHKAYAERMFMLRMHPPGGKPKVLCASYPGVLPGNAPWINDVGVIMTTNFIYSRDVRLGVGRYFLDRLAMEARTPEEALRICSHPDRAYAFHHVIGSTSDGRVVSLEVTPTKLSQVEIKGLYIHTNHLIHDKLAGEAQDPEYVSTSSGTRLGALRAWKAALNKEPSALTAADLVTGLSSHEGKPYSPCRHPEGEVHGATLLTAVFESSGKGVRVYKNQPCLGKDHRFGG
jgi:predicted choloylglycine hydrolase